MYNKYVPQRSQIQFEDEEHAVYMSNKYTVFVENHNLGRFDIV